MKRSALLVVDMLADFSAPNKASRPQKIYGSYREQPSIPIDRHFKLSIPHAIIGKQKALVVEELEYDDGKEFIVEKKLYDGFYNTRLDSILHGTTRRVARGV
jgi:nicotinamidase-related amidase